MEVKINCAIHTSAPLSLLKPIQGNLKDLTESNYERLKTEILDEGFVFPFFIWIKDGVKWLIDGHQRQRALLKMKEQGVNMPDDFPVYEIYAKTYREACKRVLAASSQYGLMTKQGLYEFAEKNDLKDDLPRYHFDAFAMEEFNEEYYDDDVVPDEIDDEVPDVDENNVYVKNGDLWLLGDHRVLCGDSTIESNYAKLHNGVMSDLTFTSPPYNAGCFGYDGGKSKYKKKSDDNLNQDDYFVFLEKFIDISLNYSKLSIINNQFLSNNRYALGKMFGHYSNNIKEVFPWIKNTAPPNVNKGFFTNRFEFFLCLEKDNKKKGFDVGWQGKYHNIIEGKTAANENTLIGSHSATMPIYLPLWFFERLNFIITVLDPFLGSGTTLIACEKTSRKCFGMELETFYVQAIIERYITFMQKENKEFEIKCERDGKTYSLDQIKLQNK